MRRIFLYIALALGVMCSAQSKLKLKSSTVDTNMTYLDQQFNLNEWNDCSVRVIATLFTGRKYYIAHDLLKQYGRESRQGVKASTLNTLIQEQYTDRHLGVINWSKSLRKFLKTTAKDNESYVIITPSHTYAVIRTGNVWRAFGNPQDTVKPIVAIIKIKR